MSPDEPLQNSSSSPADGYVSSDAEGGRWYDVHLIFLPVDPKWRPYRNDPRFQDLLRRCGFQETHTQPRGDAAPAR